MLFVIPLWRISKKNKHRQENIYNVLVSLDSKLVLEEIEKLKKIEEEVFIYRYNLETSQRASNFRVETGKSSGSIKQEHEMHRR